MYIVVCLAWVLAPLSPMLVWYTLPMHPQLFKATIQQKLQLTPKTTQLVLHLVAPAHIDPVPGQFVSLKVSTTAEIFRPYSIVKVSGATTLTLLVATGHDGLGSNFVNSLKTGDTVWFVGPAGRFHLKQPVSDTLYFFATGTGIAPFISMFLQLTAQNYLGNVTLFYGIRHREDVLMVHNLDGFKSSLPNFKYELFVSSETGRVTEALSRITDLSADFYMCGNPAMVKDIMTALKAKGVSEDRLLAEAF